MFEAALFYMFSALAILAGVLVVTLRNPISSAVALVSSFLCLAAIYAILGAHFVAVIQVLVYAGAIMVLFIFVIMLLNLRDEVAVPWGDFSPRVVFGFVVAALLGGGLVIAFLIAEVHGSQIMFHLPAVRHSVMVAISGIWKSSLQELLNIGQAIVVIVQPCIRIRHGIQAHLHLPPIILIYPMG